MISAARGEVAGETIAVRNRGLLRVDRCRDAATPDRDVERDAFAALVTIRLSLTLFLPANNKLSLP
jgi:hypothetical protein